MCFFSFTRVASRWTKTAKTSSCSLIREAISNHDGSNSYDFEGKIMAHASKGGVVFSSLLPTPFLMKWSEQHGLGRCGSCGPVRALCCSTLLGHSGKTIARTMEWSGGASHRGCPRRFRAHCARGCSDRDNGAERSSRPQQSPSRETVPKRDVHGREQVLSLFNWLALCQRTQTSGCAPRRSYPWPAM